MATDYSAVLAAKGHGSKKWTSAGIGDEGYANLVRTWTDVAPIPSQATLDAAWPAVEADIALIDDMPTDREISDVGVGLIIGTDADNIRDRVVASRAAKLRIP